MSRPKTGTSSAAGSPAGSSRFHVFPWREEEGFGGRRVLRPTLFVTLQLADLTTTTKALVDTGAPRCVFPRGSGAMLGLDLPKEYESEKTIYLAGEHWPAVAAIVTVRLPPFEDVWEAEVDFVLSEGLPFALLGDEGFLNRWAVSFVSCHSYFVVEPIEDFESRIPPDPFGEFQQRYPDPYAPRPG